jgi:cell division transport system ATP-binding protein
MIRFTTVTKDFGTGSPALSNVTLTVNPGEFVFLTGPSGSGKTTLLKLITKEYTPTTGEIEFDGQILNDLRGSKIHHHRRRIGVVFQDYRLLPELNVWENIALALQIVGKHQDEIEERVTDLLELIQLTDKAYHFPTQLSGGESQRVSIARALATAPQVLLADEPTGNLDPQNSAMIAKLFHKIHSLGTTVLFATHDSSILSQLDHRRIYLEKGVVLSDTPKGQAVSKSPGKSEPKSVPAETKPSQKSEAPSVTPVTSTVVTEITATVLPPAAESPEPVSSKTMGKTRFQRFVANLPFQKKTSPPPAPPAEPKTTQSSQPSPKNEVADEAEPVAVTATVQVETLEPSEPKLPDQNTTSAKKPAKETKEAVKKPKKSVKEISLDEEDEE